MKAKKYGKDAWKKLTSPKAKAAYKKAGKNIAGFGHKAHVYVKKTNNALDEIVGTYDNSPKGKLAGVKAKKPKKVKYYY